MSLVFDHLARFDRAYRPGYLLHPVHPGPRQLPVSGYRRVATTPNMISRQ
jgi:hypothetical protein